MKATGQYLGVRGGGVNCFKTERGVREGDMGLVGAGALLPKEATLGEKLETTVHGMDQ